MSETDIINKHRLSTQSINTASPHRHILIIYWLLKLHKHPFKFPVKVLPINLCCPNKHISYNQTTCCQFYHKAYEHSGIDHSWSIENSAEVLDRLRSLDRMDGPLYLVHHTTT